MTELAILNEGVMTMTSTQFCEMTGRNKSDINKEIRRQFQQEIDEGVITSSLDSRGYVTDYHLPETESIMLAAMLDKSYLRKISEYWKGRAGKVSTVPAQMLPMQVAETTLTSALNICKLLSVPQAYALTESVKLSEQQSGIDLAGLLNHSPVLDNIPEEALMLEPTELGAKFNLSAVRINKMLAHLGLQEKVSGAWEATELGSSMSVVHNWRIGSKSGYNLKWNLAAVKEVWKD